MKQFSLVLMMFLFAITSVVAQKAVSGTVTDSTGEPLIGANVVVKGTTNGAATDFDGKFSVSNVNEGDILEFTYTGFDSKEFTVGSESELNVILSEGVTLQTAVVTALGLKKEEKALPYAVQKLSGDELTSIPQTNVNNALAGKIAGVQVRSQSGAKLGSGVSVRIRGAVGLGDVSDPLYVMDGTPVGSIDINPDDIGEITVLKGPNATALYGIRGANGVVIITSKKGTKSKGIGVNVNQSTFFDNVYIIPSYQNSYAGGASSDFLVFQHQAGMPSDWAALDGQVYHDYTDDSSWGPRINGQQYIPWHAWYPDSPSYMQTEALEANPDNVRDFYETGMTLNNNISFAKGGDNYNARVSFTNQNITGIIPNSSLDKYILSASTSIDLSKVVTIGANINYVNQTLKGEFDDGYANNSAGNFNQWFHRNLDMNVLKDLRNLRSPNGRLASWNHLNPSAALASSLPDGFSSAEDYFYAGNYWYNPYAYFDNTDNSAKRDRFFGDLNVKFNVTDKITLRGAVRRNQRSDYLENRTPFIIEQSASQSGFRAGVSLEERFYAENNFDLTVSFSDRVSETVSLDLDVGGNLRQNTYRTSGGSTVDGLSIPDLFTLNNSATLPYTTISYRESTEHQSVFANASVGIKDMLYINASARNDWSSTLPVDNNSYFYPGVGLSFVFSEVIGTELPFLSYGKLRLGWAQVGNDLSAYSLALTYPVGSDQFGDGNVLQATPNTIVDAAIKPSINSSYEAGLDLRFLNNRLGTNFTYYFEKREDEILTVPVSGTSGFTNQIINAGQINRSGFELALFANPVKSGDWNLDLNFNLGVNDSEIVELSDPNNDEEAFIQATGTFGTSSGVRLVHQEGQQWGQLRGGGFKTINGQRVIDENGKYVKEDDKYFGTVLPDFTGGASAALSWKSFSLNATVDFSKGGKYFSLSDHWGAFSGLMERTAGVNDKGNPVRDPVADGGGVRVDGVDENGAAVSTYVEGRTYYQQFRGSRISEEHVYDMDFVKLREVNLTYKVPVQKLGLKGLQSATVAFIANNPWLIYTPNRDFDPSEMSQTYGEDGQFPGTRSFGFKIGLGF